ncbi:MAG: hypothetical protein Q7T15_06700 [Microcella sp.]|uniref:hypothetical protein n=1 Tax=Microcella sp. TaxID=1913979 RepID=UPI002728CFC0|nr:hypothetical protein [Microcella sp.]MDO8337928.1 hypothetical protein [Microcella sp.]
MTVDGARMPRRALLDAVAAALHLAAGLVLLAGAGRLTVELPVRLSAPGVPAEPFASVDLAAAAAVVVLVSAVARLTASIPPLRDRVDEQLARGRAGWRWLELSQTASITVVLVALLNGVSEAGVLVAIYALAAGAVLLLWIQDRQTKPGPRGLAAFSAGAAIGIVPWGVVALYQVTRLLVGEPVSDVVSAGTVALLVLAAASWFSVWWHRECRRSAHATADAERAATLIGLAHTAALLAVVLLLG